ncbi:hypothetical protein RBB50_012209 [Rhinocladiella similis]
MAQRLNQITAQIHASVTDNSQLLHDQVIIVTGAGSGIGKATAELLAQHGARIVACDLDAGKLDGLSNDLATITPRPQLLTFVGNLMDEGIPERLVKEALCKFGKVDSLINTAGFLYDSAISKMTDKQFDMVLDIHLRVPFRLVRALSHHFMDPQHRDRCKTIVNISSTSGIHGQLGQINYASAKAGVIGFTKAIALEWARYNVRCNAAAFGWLETAMTQAKENGKSLQVGQEKIPLGVSLAAKKFRDISEIPLGRPGTASEAAGTILYLASPLSSYTTGQVVEVNGGRFT